MSVLIASKNFPNSKTLHYFTPQAVAEGLGYQFFMFGTCNFKWVWYNVSRQMCFYLEPLSIRCAYEVHVFIHDFLTCMQFLVRCTMVLHVSRCLAVQRLSLGCVWQPFAYLSYAIEQVSSACSCVNGYRQACSHVCGYRLALVVMYVAIVLCMLMQVARTYIGYPYVCSLAYTLTLRRHLPNVRVNCVLVDRNVS